MVNLDVLVIGAGTAGTYAASTARRYTNSVGIVEKGQVGGDCIFNACIPTKALVHAARVYKKMKTADFFGLPVIDQAVDFKNVRAFKDRIISNITGTGRDKRLTGSGIRVFRGSAKFVAPHEISVTNEIIRADRIIITTGSVPAIPPVPGLKEAGYITNIEALKLEKVPERLAIIGGGPIGVEFAQIFSAFGSKVHIYEATESILSIEDEEVSQTIAGLFEKQGIIVSTSVKISEVKSSGAGKLINSVDSRGQKQSREFDAILVATGRRPAIDELNLTVAGVQMTRKGIVVDSALRTNIPHIWAAGDVTGSPLFTYVAWQQGEIAGANANIREQKEINYDILPRATFCDPEIASVGLTEQRAHEKGRRIITGKFDYANLTRSIVADEMDGFIKIVADAYSGQILGGHILGTEASSLIHEITAAMAGKLTVNDIGNTFHSYPTFSEGIRYACQSIQPALKKSSGSPAGIS